MYKYDHKKKMALKIENNYDFNDNTNNTTDNNFDSKWTEPSKCTLIELFFECTNRKRVQRKWSHWVKNESDLVIIVFSIWFAIDPLLCLLEICQLCIFSVDFIGARICRCSAFWRHIKSNGSTKETIIINGMNIQNDCHESRLAIARYIIIDSFLLFAIFLNHSSDSVQCHNFSDIP